MIHIFQKKKYLTTTDYSLKLKIFDRLSPNVNK